MTPTSSAATALDVGVVHTGSAEPGAIDFNRSAAAPRSEPVFRTITGDDWRRTFLRFRTERNLVRERIRARFEKL